MARALSIAVCLAISVSTASGVRAQDLDLFDEAEGGIEVGAETAPEAHQEDDAAADLEEDEAALEDGAGDAIDGDAPDGGDGEEAEGVEDGDGDGPGEALAVAGWTLAVSAEAGIGTRDLDVPADGVINRVSLGLFAVAGLGLELQAPLGDGFSIGLRGRYQTSVGRKVVEQQTDGRMQAQGVRAHRLEVALAPSVRLSDAGDWALSAALGYALTELRPEVRQLETPIAGLSALFARIAFQLPLGWERLLLTVAPEGQWIFHVSDELRAKSGAEAGVGFGGEAALELLLGPLRVGLTYRELHAVLSSDQADPVLDVSRFVTARLLGVL